MAVASASSPQTLDPNPEAGNAPSSATSDPSPSAPPPPAAAAASAPPEAPASNPANPIPNTAPIVPPPPAVPSFAPSFRPLGAPPVPQYTAVPIPMAQNPAYQIPMAQAPGIQPPGVSAPASIMPPGAAPGSVPPLRPGVPYQVAPGQPPAPLPYGQVGNGYMAVPPQGPMGMPPPGMPRYPSPYPTMIHPGFPMRPIPPTGVIPQLQRPPIPNIRGLPPVVSPVIRPAVPIAAPTEKPQTTVYVGKIASTVENEFLLSILTLCGPVKSLKRAQDPSDGKPKGFGFCEFETAEGVLRSLRLLTKLNIDGQELMVNIKQATREYLERYVEMKIEREKLKETDSGGPAKENATKEGSEKQEPRKPVEEEAKKDSEDSGDKDDQERYKTFGIVTDEDREADKDALEKITQMIEERLKNKPLPPPLSVDGSAITSELPSKSRDGDSDVDITRGDAAEDKNDEETTSENKPAVEGDKPETGSPDRSRRHDGRSRDRDRERDFKREKERELERVERDRERERVRRERERDMKLREAERLYKDRLKEWEAREREKEYQRQYEKDREKERERERRKEILRQEDESSDDDDDGDSRKRRRRSSLLEEKRRKRQREKEEDLDDRLREEEEIAEAKRRAIEEQQLKLDSKSPVKVTRDSENQNPTTQEEGKYIEGDGIVSDQTNEISGNVVNNADDISRNSSADDFDMVPVATPETKQNINAPARKLGFGLIGSGKRTTVPSVFHEEDDEDQDDKKMRPLVPIDYSTEELQAVQTNASGPQPNLVAAAEFAKRISGANAKEEMPDADRERNRRSSDKLNLRERERNNDENTRSRDESREKTHEKNVDREKNREDKPKAENKKLLDAKQLIDMIPKTKEELFVYEINWDIYDKHQLHERMRPWISKKITEFLGEEEATLVEYIVSCVKDHVQASTMLEMLQSILDDEAEMFVLKMWRMLIFEIKKVETGISMKSKS